MTVTKSFESGGDPTLKLDEILAYSVGVAMTSAGQRRIDGIYMHSKAVIICIWKSRTQELHAKSDSPYIHRAHTSTAPAMVGLLLSGLAAFNRSPSMLQ